jgi:hypothetical protein
MNRIVLTSDQSNVLERAHNPIDVQDSQGRIVGRLIPPALAAEIERAKQSAKSQGPRFTTEQVVGHLKALEAEWERTGGFDEAYMREFLNKIRAGESA